MGKTENWNPKTKIQSFFGVLDFQKHTLVYNIAALQIWLEWELKILGCILFRNFNKYYYYYYWYVFPFYFNFFFASIWLNQTRLCLQKAGCSLTKIKKLGTYKSGWSTVSNSSTAFFCTNDNLFSSWIKVIYCLGPKST